jgi:gamma-glutamyl hercynylcysteine S-oxide hydrolase
MCRHLGWLGAPRSLHELVLAPPCGLLVQSYAPRRQAHGLLNADGWGVGFWPAEGGVGLGSGPVSGPARWRSSRPLWSDASFASVSPLLRSGCVVAAVRSATPGMPPDETAAAPFLHDGWLISHNGRVDRRVLPPRPDAESTCDSALLAVHVVAAGMDALARTIAEVAAADPAARLNLLAADGERLVATTWGDTLSLLELDDGVVLASEPWDDDPRWTDLPDRHLVEVTHKGVAVTPLETAKGSPR